MPPRDDSALVQVAKLYYREAMSQEAIARLLGLSRSNVSRMLSAAQERGIVEIHIREERPRETALEQDLRDAFPVREAVVATGDARRDALEMVGEAAWEWLRDQVKSIDRLAISWGQTLQAVASAIVPAAGTSGVRGVDVVQLVGGVSQVVSMSTAQELVRDIATRLGGTYQYLHAPAAMTSRAAVDVLLRQPSIVASLTSAREADMALVGIGSVVEGSSAAVLTDLGLDADDRRNFEASHPVGDIAARYFDAEGRPVGGPVGERVVGLSLDEIRGIPTVVAVAAGQAKVAGIRGALRGGLVDVLITDAPTAQAVLT